jgi:hypothetical protein
MGSTARESADEKHRPLENTSAVGMRMLEWLETTITHHDGHLIGVASKAPPISLPDLQINIIMNKYIYATTSRNISTIE